jgi:DNA-binding transcriptional LysR family regulator
MRLTEPGRIYYEQCRQALDQLREAERVAAGQQLLPAGMLRISAPTTYAHYRLLPLLPAFRERHPEVRVEVHVGNRNVDFSEEGFDLAIRVRSPGDSGLIMRPLENAGLVVVGSPDYLARRGTPMTIDDLQQHDCIQFDLPSSGRRIPWLFKDQGQDIELVTEGGYTISEDVLGGVTLARHGAGLFQTYRFIVEDDLRQGRLIEVLQTAAGRSRPFNLLYPSSRHVPFRVRSFIDFLLERMT